MEAENIVDSNIPAGFPGHDETSGAEESWHVAGRAVEGGGVENALVCMSYFSSKFLSTSHLLAYPHTLRTFYLSNLYFLVYFTTMRQPTTTHWMATRYGNSRAHPGAIDISNKEEDLLPKTPAPKKMSSKAKNKKLGTELEAGLERVATYEKQSLHNELSEATPQATYTPTAPHSPAESREASNEEGGKISDNASYKPPSESVTDVLMSDVEVGSLPSPVAKMVDKGKTIVGEGRKKGGVRKKVAIVVGGNSTELESEPTPFKKLMSKKGTKFRKEVFVEELTPIKMVPKGKGTNNNSPTESDDEPTLPKKSGGVMAVATKPKQAPKAPVGLDVKDSQTIADKPRPKPRPWAQVPEAAPAPTKVAPKPTSNRNPSSNSNMNVDELHPLQSKPIKPKATKPKSEVAMAKERLKEAQEAVQKVQEDQKKANAEAKKLKESMKEPGLHDRIKAINTGANAESSEQPHPLRLSQLLQGKKSNTHTDKGGAAHKPAQQPKVNKKPDPFEDIHDFGSDDESMTFSSNTGCDNWMNIDETPAEKADSHMPMTGKKGAMSGGGKKSGLTKSGNASSGKEGNRNEGAKTLVKDDKGKGQQGQVTQALCLIVVTIIDAHSKSEEALISRQLRSL